MGLLAFLIYCDLPTSWPLFRVCRDGIENVPVYCKEANFPNDYQSDLHLCGVHLRSDSMGDKAILSWQRDAHILEWDYDGQNYEPKYIHAHLLPHTNLDKAMFQFSSATRIHIFRAQSSTIA
jgi:hypothetical protein